MNSSEEPQGTGVPPAGTTPAGSGAHETPVQPAEPVDSYDDGYPHEPPVESPPVALKPEPPPTKAVATVPRRPSGGGRKPPTPPPPSDNDGDEEEGGMLRMS